MASGDPVRRLGDAGRWADRLLQPAAVARATARRRPAAGHPDRRADRAAPAGPVALGRGRPARAGSYPNARPARGPRRRRTTRNAAQPARTGAAAGRGVRRRRPGALLHPAPAARRRSARAIRGAAAGAIRQSAHPPGGSRGAHQPARRPVAHPGLARGPRLRGALRSAHPPLVPHGPGRGATGAHAGLPLLHHAAARHHAGPALAGHARAGAGRRPAVGHPGRTTAVPATDARAPPGFAQRRGRAGQRRPPRCHKRRLRRRAGRRCAGLAGRQGAAGPGAEPADPGARGRVAGAGACRRATQRSGHPGVGVARGALDLVAGAARGRTTAAPRAAGARHPTLRVP